MKRSPLRRGKPLARSSSLARSGGLKRGGPLKRSRIARARGPTSEEAEFRRGVLARAGGRCERCGSTSNVEAHHIVPRSRAPAAIKHTLGNGAALCSTCHAAVHEHRAEDWRRWLR